MSKDRPYVVLVHGFLRTKKSWKKMAHFLRTQDYEVVDFTYPAKYLGVRQIVEKYLLPCVATLDPERTVHFVTHSLGGILVRYFLVCQAVLNIGRVVALAPPYQGSKLASFLAKNTFLARNFPCLKDLSPGSFVLTHLGVAKPYFATIAGTKDKKVTPAQAWYSEQEAFITVSRTHSFIMNAPEVHKLTGSFL